MSLDERLRKIAQFLTASSPAVCDDARAVGKEPGVVFKRSEIILECI